MEVALTGTGTQVAKEHSATSESSQSEVTKDLGNKKILEKEQSFSSEEQTRIVEKSDNASALSESSVVEQKFSSSTVIESSSTFSSKKVSSSVTSSSTVFGEQEIQELEFEIS